MSKHKNLIDQMQTERKTICEFCGKEKEGLAFMIGASRVPAWVMVEGTGKMSCLIAGLMQWRKEGRQLISMLPIIMRE